MQTISMSHLGRMGRWGNQVFQYIFLRTYARRYNLSYQAPRWEGQRLFGFKDPPIIGPRLSRYDEHWDKVISHSTINNYQDAWRPSIAPKDGAVIDHDYCGYCQFHTSYYTPDKDFIQNLFIPTQEVQARIALAIGKLTQHQALPKTVIGLHLRRGDTGRAIFYLTPNEWYLAWLEEHWQAFHNPQLFIATEEPSDVKAFVAYNPITSADLLQLDLLRYLSYNYLRCDLASPTLQSMDWFPDWYLLTQCNVLLFGESTFSFSAAMVSTQLSEAWQSRLSTQTFERLDPWNAQPLRREHLDEHPPIPGTRYVRNSKWRGGEVAPKP